MALQESGGIARTESVLSAAPPAVLSANTSSLVERTVRSQDQARNQQSSSESSQSAVEAQKNSVVVSSSTDSTVVKTTTTKSRRRKGIASFSRPIDIYNAKGEFPALRLFQIARPIREQSPYSPLLSTSESQGEEESTTTALPSTAGLFTKAFVMPTDQYMSGYLVNNLV